MTMNKLTSRTAIFAILILQFIPLILMPPSSFKATNQEWWLPALLMVLSAIAVVRLFTGKNETGWPWDLISFSHGFNIISRLMLVMPHSMIIVNGKDAFNTPYVMLSIISIIASALMLLYIALPQVRVGVLQD